MGLYCDAKLKTEPLAKNAKDLMVCTLDLDLAHSPTIIILHFCLISTKKRREKLFELQEEKEKKKEKSFN